MNLHYDSVLVCHRKQFLVGTCKCCFAKKC